MMSKEQAIVELINAYQWGSQDKESVYTASLRIGRKIIPLLEEKGIKVDPSMLFDNTSYGGDGVFTVQEAENPLYRFAFRREIYAARLKETLGLSFDLKTALEVDYIDAGLAIATQLSANPPIGYHLSNNGKYLIGAHKERLKIRGYGDIVTVRGGQLPPSCQTMDAAMYQEKIAHYNLAVTILDVSFKNQQDQTRQILSWVTDKNQHPVIIVYHVEDHAVAVEGWSSEVEGICQDLAARLLTQAL